MKFRKLLSILLAILTIFSMLSVFSYADTDDVDTQETETEADAETTGSETVDIDDIVITEKGMTGDGTTGKLEDLASFTLAAENENLAFYINDITGFFALLNKKTNAIWYSNPLDWENDMIAQAGNREQLHSQLVVTYLNASYDVITVASSQAHIVSEHDGDKQILTYVFSGATRNFSIPVSYELKDDYLDVKLMIEEIEENSDARITQISLLPFLGSGGLEDNGYGLIPDGCGSLMTFNKVCKNITQYTGYIYNRDITSSSNSASYVDLNETISLPVYGMVKNGAGYLSVITEGSGTSAIKCNVSKIFNSYNSVFSHIIVRDTQTRRNATGTTGMGMYYSENTSGNLSMRVYPLSAEESNYVGMANRYNKYLQEAEGIEKLEADSSVANAINIELFCAVQSPMHFLGIPYTGTKVLTTFAQVKDIITQLKENNVDNAVITLSGWSNGGMQSSLPSKFSPYSKVGSVSEAKELIAYAEEQGVTLVFDSDFQSFYSNTGKIKKFKHTAFSLANTPVTIYPFSKSLNRSMFTGTYHHLIHPKFTLGFVEEYLDNALSTGIKNFSFNTLGVDPYAAYNTDNMVTRDESADLMKELFNSVDEKVDGIVSTRVGNSFVLGSVDNIVDAPVYSSDLIMSQTSVPFYQIALRGYINMSATAMNLSSEVSELELKCAESGVSLYYQLMKSESTVFQDTSYTDYYACSYDDYYDIMCETYDRMSKLYDAVGVSTIIGHEIVSDTARVTTFSNGAKVYVNYDYVEATINGVKVAARSYSIVGGEN